jgi:hypothetical protein
MPLFVPELPDAASQMQPAYAVQRTRMFAWPFFLPFGCSNFGNLLDWRGACYGAASRLQEACFVFGC